MIQHFREQKKCLSYVEAKFERSQICFNMVTTSFNIVERPIQMVQTFASTNVKQMFKQMLGLFELNGDVHIAAEQRYFCNSYV